MEQLGVSPSPLTTSVTSETKSLATPRTSTTTTSSDSKTAPAKVALTSTSSTTAAAAGGGATTAPATPAGGLYLLSGGRDKVIKLWLVESGECLRTLVMTYLPATMSLLSLFLPLLSYSASTSQLVVTNRLHCMIWYGVMVV
jgi:WD40 repeat protein